MTKLENVIKRLEDQYESYEKERVQEDGMIDIALACNLADSVPYLIEQLQALQLQISLFEKGEYLVGKIDEWLHKSNMHSDDFDMMFANELLTLMNEDKGE